MRLEAGGKRQRVRVAQTIKYLRRTPGAVAVNGLGTTPNYLRGAAVNGRAQR